MRLYLAITFSIIFCTTAYAGVTVQNGLTHTHQLVKGQRITGKVVLKNIGNKSERVLVYLKDFNRTCDGSVAYLDPGTNSRTLSTYLSTSNSDYTLVAGETYELTYEINVPASVDIKGSLWSLLMIEITEPLAEQQIETGVKVGSKIRYGVQIIASTPETEGTEIKFTDVQIESSKAGQKIVNVQLQNNGSLYAKPHLELQLFNEKAEMVGEFRSISKKVYPGNCQFYSVELTEFPPGTYKAIMIADYDNNAVGVNLTIQY